jgi:4-hydroxybenzoate polyprenyltransferase
VPIALCLGVTLWTAGFDIYYSCQDEEFDREHGLNSVPARIGALRSIRLVRPIHVGAVCFYILFGIFAGMGAIFYLGLAAVAAILVYEAWLLRTGDLSRIDLAFFNLNGYVSLLFAAASMVDVLVVG